MATIEKKNCGYKITVSCGYDAEGKQIRKRMTWTPDPGMTKRQIEKALNRQATLFEEQVKTGGVVVSGKIRLRDYLEQFMENYVKVYRQPNTIARYEREAKRMLSLLADEPIKWRALITFDLLSGLRRGELLGLQWGDIDFDNHLVHIERTWNYTSTTGCYFGPTKTARSRRPLHLSTSVFVVLLEYQRWQNSQRAALGDAWKGTTDDDRVFTTDEGAPMFPTAPTWWLRKFTERTGLPQVSIHSLRHTFASLMIADDVPIVEVSSQLGHAKASTTTNIYGHVIASAHAKALTTFSRFDDIVAPAPIPIKKKASGE